MRIELRSLLVLSAVIYVISCQNGQIPKEAKPVGASLVEYELVGNVRSVITEVNEPNKKESVGSERDTYLSTSAFDRNGILNEHGFLRKKDGRVAEKTIIYSVLDNKGRLIKTINQSDSKGIEESEYQYSIKNQSIILKPINKGNSVRDATWYEQEIRQNSYMTIVHWGDSDDVIKRSTFEYNRIQDSCLYDPYSGKKNCIQYRNNRKSTMTIFDLNSDDPVEVNYKYESSSEWPSGAVHAFQGKIQRVEAYEYSLDSRNNWIEKKTYEITPSGSRELVLKEERTIQYY